VKYGFILKLKELLNFILQTITKKKEKANKQTKGKKKNQN